MKAIHWTGAPDEMLALVLRLAALPFADDGPWGLHQRVFRGTPFVAFDDIVRGFARAACWERNSAAIWRRFGSPLLRCERDQLGA